MFEPFAHFLAYGSTDQQTLRELTSQYRGIVVPGTIAAFQSEGTRGFVLSLSASEHFPYVIDPRSPLFQTYLSEPKQSHISLARILGLSEVVEEHGSVPTNFWTLAESRRVAQNWIAFNTAYIALQPKAFDKYARRLKKPLPQSNAQGPAWIIAPYLMESPDYPGAREITADLWNESKSAAEGANVGSLLRRVVAVTDPATLEQAVQQVPEQEIIVWVSNLDELDPTNYERMKSYAHSIAALTQLGKKPFALYGGYFSVTLRSLGLVGASHGVGFSEHRNHVELKSSGGAPARYYVERAHRFFPVDLASELWRRDKNLVASMYAGYPDLDPQEMSYHDLMMHSVRARQHEIEHTSTFSVAEHVADLRNTFDALDADLAGIRLTEGLRKRVNANIAHLRIWASVLSEVQ